METINKDIELTHRVQKGLAIKNEQRFVDRDLWLEALTVLDRESRKLPLVKRKALAISKVLHEMPIKIEDHELIVGFSVHNSVGGGTPFPEYATDEEKGRAARRLTGTYSVFGHFCPSYPMILRAGVGGLKALAQEKLEALTEQQGDAETMAWYEAVLISLDGLSALMNRYAALAADLSETADAPVRKEELMDISRISERLAQDPPQSFREALQLLWFSHISFESTMNFLALGRFDQNLWPFLEKDLAEKRCTLEQAQELIDCLWLKFNDRLSTFDVASQQKRTPMSPMTARELVGHTAGTWSLFLGGRTTHDRLVPLQGTEFNTWLQSMSLSGLTPDGRDGTNPLTYLCLNATRRLKLPQPSIYVRLHDGSPAELYHRAVDCIQNSVGPSIFNDEVIIPAMEKQGIPTREARDYTTDGCWETFIEGKSQFKYGIISAPEALHRTLFPGRWDEEAVSLVYDERFDPFADSDLPDPSAFGGYDDLWSSFKDQLDRYIKGAVEAVDVLWDGRLYDIAPLPLISACMEGPLEAGADLTKHGVKYSIFTPFLSGLSHAADSLAAIKKLCFEEKLIDWKDWLDAVECNWEGRETLQQMVISRSPAYGNDIDYVDDIAREITEFYIERVETYAAESQNGILFNPSVGTFQLYIGIGSLLPATPDGRRAHEPVGSNASPTNGRAKNGQTAAVNSYLKLPLADMPTGAPLDLAMDARSNNLIEPFIRSFIDRGGNLLSISINDVEKLKAAMKEPEKYRDLKIRIGGWEAFFVDLPPAYQQWQIKKYEQYSS